MHITNMKMFVNETLCWCENSATALGPHFFFKIRISFLVFKNGYMHALCLSTPWHGLDQTDMSWFTTDR